MKDKKNKRGFDGFGFNDAKRYLNRLLIRLLEEIFYDKRELTLDDLTNAYEQCRVLLEVNRPKCCLAQLGDVGVVKRDAVELANYIKTYLLLRLYDQPKNKRLEICKYLEMVCVLRASAQGAGTSGDTSTFFGVFQLLGVEMFFFDEKMSGENFKLKPALERFLNEKGPGIVSKIKKYNKDSSLGDHECQICTNCWMEESNIKSLRFVHCFQTREQVESFLAESFRRTFYMELGKYLRHIEGNFSDNGK